MIQYKKPIILFKKKILSSERKYKKEEINNYTNNIIIKNNNNNKKKNERNILSNILSEYNFNQNKKKEKYKHGNNIYIKTEKKEKDKIDIFKKRNLSNYKKYRFNNNTKKKNFSVPKINLYKDIQEIKEIKVNLNKNVDEEKIIILNSMIENQILNDLRGNQNILFENNQKKTKRKKDIIGQCINVLSIDSGEVFYKLNRKLEENIIDYKIETIIYTLNSNCIQSLILIYKKRKSISLKNIKTKKCYFIQGNNHIINIPDIYEIKLEEIYKILGKDVGFKIRCGENFYTIGYYVGLDFPNNPDKNNINDITKLEDNFIKVNEKNNFEIIKIGNQALFGIEAKACLKDGISNINFKLKNGIDIYSRLFELRAKLKINPQYKREFLIKKSLMNEKNRLIGEICSLPDTSFFPIMSYITHI